MSQPPGEHVCDESDSTWSACLSPLSLTTRAEDISHTLEYTLPDLNQHHPRRLNSEMAIPPARVSQVLSATSALIGILTLTGGIYGLADSFAFSQRIGLHGCSADSPALRYLKIAAARNVASGAALLALLYRGQKKVVGMVMIGTVAVAVVDAWIYARFGVDEERTAGHVVVGVMVGLLGWGMYYYGKRDRFS